jgi:uncharacterized phage protein gp47/JayE
VPIGSEILFRSRAEIVEQLISEMQSLVPDVYVGEDGNLRMLFEVHAGVSESVFLALQILSEDMFVQSASPTALDKWGVEFGVARKLGTIAEGEVVFTGAGGTYVPIGTRIAHNPGANAPLLYFVVTEDGTIPAPGIPTAPTATLGAAGNINGLIEYVVTFITGMGETLPGPPSSGVDAVSQQISVEDIPLGGTGTIERKLYRAKDGGLFQLVTTINDNTTTTYNDNVADGSLGSFAPIVSTAERITLDAEAETYGTAYNVGPNAISELIEIPDGITDVSNSQAFAGGTDPETTNSFRGHLLGVIRSPATGSPQDLKSWAESVNGVESATIFPNMDVETPTAGHTTVRISGPGGIVPDVDVIAAVLEELESKDLANITIHVTTFDPLSTNVTVDIDINSEFTSSQVVPNVEAAIRAYINALEVGETLKIAGILGSVFQIAGVDDVRMTTPTTNQTTGSTEKRIPGIISVT